MACIYQTKKGCPPSIGRPSPWRILCIWIWYAMRAYVDICLGLWAEVRWDGPAMCRRFVDWARTERIVRRYRLIASAPGRFGFLGHRAGCVFALLLCLYGGGGGLSRLRWDEKRNETHSPKMCAERRPFTTITGRWREGIGCGSNCSNLGRTVLIYTSMEHNITFFSKHKKTRKKRTRTTPKTTPPLTTMMMMMSTFGMGGGGRRERWWMVRGY